MKQPGVIVYGYSKNEAIGLQRHLENSLSKKLKMISGIGLENEKLKNIILYRSSKFDIRRSKFLIFFGLPRDDIEKLIESIWIKWKEYHSPIIAELNEVNSEWTLRELLIKLQSEVNFFQKTDIERKVPDTLSFMFKLLLLLFIGFIVLLVIFVSTGLSAIESLTYSYNFISILFFLIMLYIICDIYLRTKINFERINDIEQKLDQQKKKLDQTK